MTRHSLRCPRVGNRGFNFYKKEGAIVLWIRSTREGKFLFVIDERGHRMSAGREPTWSYTSLECRIARILNRYSPLLPSLTKNKGCRCSSYCPQLMPLPGRCQNRDRSAHTPERNLGKSDTTPSIVIDLYVRLFDGQSSTRSKRLSNCIYHGV